MRGAREAIRPVRERQMKDREVSQVAPGLLPYTVGGERGGGWLAVRLKDKSAPKVSYRE